MAGITTAPGLLSIDPIQGLVDYVQEIKPYHTKVFEVLFEYVYADAVNTTVKDTLMMTMDDNQTYYTSTIDPAFNSTPSYTIDVTGLGYSDGTYTNVPFSGGSGSGAFATVIFTTTRVYQDPGVLNSITPPVSIFSDTNTEMLYSPYTATPPGIIQRASIIFTDLPGGYTPGDVLSVNPADIGGTGPTLNVTLVSTNTAIANSVWFNPTTKILYIRKYDNTGWIEYQTGLTANPSPGSNVDTSVTEFIETIAFDWTGNYSYTIVATDTGANTITVIPSTAIISTSAPISPTPGQFWYNPTTLILSQWNEVIWALTGGNLTNALKPEDLTDITDTDDDGPHTIVSFTYDAIHNTTLVTLDSVPTSLGGTPVFTVQDVDITYWYQFAVLSVNPILTPPSQSPLPYAQNNTNAIILITQPNLVIPGVASITVAGNATTSVQVGAVFQIQGSQANDGLYHAVYVQYEPISNQTTIGVDQTTGVPAPVLSGGPGGLLVPYRFIDEVFEGSYDNGGYDSGVFDESAGSLIHQGP